MSQRPDEHVRPLLGAFALGHLDEAESTAVRVHLDGCAAGRDEAAELAAVADLLPLADPGRVGRPAEQPREMLAEVLARIEQERGERSKARRRAVTARVGAAAAMIALLVVAGLTMRSVDDPGGEIVALTARRPGVAGQAVVHEDPRSTWVELTVSGLPVGETYGVWLEETGTGERSPLGTFTGTPGELYISLYSTLPRDRAASVGVSDADGATVLVGSVPAGSA